MTPKRGALLEGARWHHAKPHGVVHGIVAVSVRFLVVIGSNEPASSSQKLARVNIIST